MLWRSMWLLLGRGLRLRCPYCGVGKLFVSSWSSKMYERCAVCDWVFEREEGYWTGAMAVNLIGTELLVALFALPMAYLIGVGRLPLWPPVILGLVATAALPFLFYRHSKSLWMALDFLIHPIERDVERERPRAPAQRG